MNRSRCLIAYFSRKGQNYVNGDITDLPIGNTEIAAGMIQAATGGDLFHLEPATEYPAGYHEATEVAQKELRRKARPELKEQPGSLDGYEVVFLGYPNWWGTAPMPVFTFLESHDFTGKTILPFCTHEGSGLGHSESDIRKACPGARVMGSLAIKGGSVQGAEGDIQRWVEATDLEP